MILDSTLKLECVLAGAKSTLDPEVHVEFTDWNKAGEQTPPAIIRNALNGTTVVIVLAAPVLNLVRQIESITIYNKDNASVTVTVQTNDGTTVRILRHETLATLKTLFWGRQPGWQLQA